jgi:hypothetical protein
LQTQLLQPSQPLEVRQARVGEFGMGQVEPPQALQAAQQVSHFASVLRRPPVPGQGNGADADPQGRQTPGAGRRGQDTLCAAERFATLATAQLDCGAWTYGEACRQGAQAAPPS